METLQDFVAATLDAPFDFNVRYSIFYLLCTVLIAFVRDPDGYVIELIDVDSTN